MKQRHYIIILASFQESANATCHQLGIDPLGLLNSFKHALVPVGGPDDAEPTHYIADGQLPEELWTVLAELEGSYPGCVWWRVEDQQWGEGKIVATNTAAEVDAHWTLSSALTALGLKRRVVDLGM